MRKINHKSGYILLMSALVLSALGIAVVVGVLNGSINISQITLSKSGYYTARWLSHACVEEALQQIRDSTPFSGVGSLSLSSGSCDYEVLSGTGQNREVRAWSIINDFHSLVEITIDTINPQINITSWQEVESF